MELPLRDPITLFVCVKGERVVRELEAVLSTGSTYTVISNKDALQMGYFPLYEPTAPQVGKGVVALTAGIVIEAPVITLQEVRVGELVVKDLEAIVYDLPEPSAVAMILGTNFLKHFRTTIDYERGILRIEEM